jgi:hypothetical protein
VAEAMHGGLLPDRCFSGGSAVAEHRFWILRTLSARAFSDGESMAMGHYRIYELDSVDQILDEYSVVCRSDVAAIVAVCQLEERAAAVEVWARAHCIARLTAAEAAVPKACSLNASGPVGVP